MTSSPGSKPTFVAFLGLAEELHVHPAHHGGAAPMTGKDDAFLPELVQ